MESAGALKKILDAVALYRLSVIVQCGSVVGRKTSEQFTRSLKYISLRKFNSFVCITSGLESGTRDHAWQERERKESTAVKVMTFCKFIMPHTVIFCLWCRSRSVTKCNPWLFIHRELTCKYIEVVKLGLSVFSKEQSVKGSNPILLGQSPRLCHESRGVS